MTPSGVTSRSMTERLKAATSVAASRSSLPISPSTRAIVSLATAAADLLVAIVPERRLNNGQPSGHAMLIVRADPRPGEHAVHIGAGSEHPEAACLNAASSNLPGSGRCECCGPQISRCSF